MLSGARLGPYHFTRKLLTRNRRRVYTLPPPLHFLYRISSHSSCLRRLQGCSTKLTLGGSFLHTATNASPSMLRPQSQMQRQSQHTEAARKHIRIGVDRLCSLVRLLLFTIGPSRIRAMTSAARTGARRWYSLDTVSRLQVKIETGSALWKHPLTRSLNNCPED